MNEWAQFVSDLTDLEGKTFTEEDAVAIITKVSALKKAEYKKGYKKGLAEGRREAEYKASMVMQRSEMF